MVSPKINIPPRTDVAMPRTMLTDKAWKALKQILKETGRVYNKYEHRNTLEGILYRMRTGCPWRDLPEAFGLWNTVYKRFNTWSASGKLMRIFSSLVEDPDVEWLFIDGSYVKAHQDSTGAATEDAEAIGKSRAGNTSKIHLETSNGDRIRIHNYIECISSNISKTKAGTTTTVITSAYAAFIYNS